MPKQQLILLHNLNIKIQKDVFLQTCMSVTFAGQFFTPKKIEQFVLIVHQLPLLLRLSSQRKMLPLFTDILYKKIRMIENFLLSFFDLFSFWFLFYFTSFFCCALLLVFGATSCDTVQKQLCGGVLWKRCF